MAHELEIVDGVAQAAFGLEPAWHRLGIVLPRYITSKEALELVPVLNSEVVKKPVMYDGQEVLGKKHTVRVLDNKPLGVVGDRYRVLQNSEALNLLDSLVKDGEAQYVSLLSLKGGTQVAFVIHLEGLGVKVGGVDAVDSYLFLSNSHDGSTAVTAMVSPIRVVCNNTLQYALAGGGGPGPKASHKVRHSTNMLERLAEVDAVIGLTQDYMTEFERDATKLMETPMSDSQWEEFLGKLVVIPEDAGRAKTIAINKHHELTSVWVNLDQTAAADFKHTKWGAIQAVSHFNQRLAPVRAKGSGEEQDIRKAENLFFRTFTGNPSNLTDKAHKMLVTA